MTERYRAENERSTWMRFHTQTAGVSLTPQQPLNNLTRVATQALAAVLGGTQSLHTDAYDEALAVPTAEAALLALRQQQVIAEETGVANTIDPLGGSWFVEALTNETEREVWRYLDEIDRRGGMVAAIGEGYPQHEIADAAYRFQREFDAGERRIVGVNAYVDENEETPIPVLSVPPGLVRGPAWPASSGPAASATPSAVESALAGLRDAAVAARLERDEPDAALPPLRRGVRDARRAVRRPARRLRGVPRARPRSEGPPTSRVARSRSGAYAASPRRARPMPRRAGRRAGRARGHGRATISSDEDGEPVHAATITPTRPPTTSERLRLGRRRGRPVRGARGGSPVAPARRGRTSSRRRAM